MNKHISYTSLALSLVVLVAANGLEAKRPSHRKAGHSRSTHMAVKQAKQILHANKREIKKAVHKVAVKQATQILQAKNKRITKKSIKHVANHQAKKMLRVIKKETIKGALKKRSAKRAKR